jgi:uncharacterized protein (TIGR03437 family)
LISRASLLPFLLALVCATTVSSQPRLRLSRTSLGPFSFATGADLPEQTVEAQNLGGNALNLSVASDSLWIEPRIDEPVSCSFSAGECIPIRLSMRTSILERGTHTAVIAVSDPAAINAPQTVRVTVYAGGGIPDRMDFYLTPGGEETRPLASSQPLDISVSTESGGDWLSVLAIRTPFAPPMYSVTAKHLAAMPEGDYRGRINVVNRGALAEETRQVEVNLRVAAAPVIEQPAPVSVRLAEGTPGTVVTVPLVNRGTGMLSIASIESRSDGGWISAEAGGDGRSVLVHVRVSAAGLAAGDYPGEVVVTSNAANSPTTIRVRASVVPQGPPAAYVLEALDIATGDAGVTFAPGSLVALRGEHLTYGDPSRAESAPWPDTLAGAQVLVNGGVVTLASAAQHEIVLHMPMTIEPGEAVIQVFRDGISGNTIVVPVAERAPRIERLRIGDYANAVIEGDGALPVPAALGGRPARPGETVLFRLTGLGATDPVVDSGAAPPEDPRAAVSTQVGVSFPYGPVGHGVFVDGLQATLTPGKPGRYELRVTLPPDVPRGDRVNVQVYAGRWYSNRVQIAVE